MIYGLDLNRQNPEFTKAMFLVWMPQFKEFVNTEEGNVYYQEMYELANAKVYKSVFGSDWKIAMSLCIAHYLQLVANNLEVPSGSTLEQIAGGGTIKGVLSQASVGNFSKSYDIDKTVLSNKESMFWNQTSYGAALMALLQTKSLPSIFVVTSNPHPYNPRRIRFPFINNNGE